MIKIVIAHPGQQHSFHTMEALLNNYYDVRYITTVYNKPHSITKTITHFLHGDNIRRSAGRRSDKIPDDKIIQFCELYGLITILLVRFDKSKKLYRKWNDYVIKRFGKKVSRYVIKQKIDVLIMYDSSAKPCFEELYKKKTNIVKVLDVTTPVRPFQVKLYEKDIEMTGLDGVKKERSFMWDPIHSQYYKDELTYSDFFITASSFVKKSIEHFNINEERIFIVPYGVDLSKFCYSPREKHDGRLRLVFTGHLSYMKGMHHLLKAVERIGNNVELTVYGPFNKDDEYFKKHIEKNNVYLKGYVSQEQLSQEYQYYDLFVFPSLGDGFGLSVLEAMACGLPVLVSDQSGVSDIIKPFYNGMVYETENDEELYDSLMWFLNNMDRLNEIGKNAHNTALSLTWEVYDAKYRSIIQSII